MQYVVRDVNPTYRPEDALNQGPARVQLRISRTGIEPRIARLGAALEANLGFPVGVEMRVVLGGLRYYPSRLRPPTGNETNPVATATS